MAREHLGATLAGTFGVVACFALYYITTAFALGYGTTALGYARNDFLIVQLGGILFMAASIAAAGYFSDRYDPRRVLIFGCVATILAGFLMAPLMESGSPAEVFLFLAIGLTCMGFCTGRWARGCRGCSRRRCAIRGRPSPSTWAVSSAARSPDRGAGPWRRRGGLAPVGLYCSACAAISLVALLIARDGGRRTEDAAPPLPTDQGWRNRPTRPDEPLVWPFSFSTSLLARQAGGERIRLQIGGDGDEGVVVPRRMWAACRAGIMIEPCVLLPPT